MRAADPAVAAEQFNALVRGALFVRVSVGLPMNHDDAAIERHVSNVVDTFLRVFGTE